MTHVEELLSVWRDAERLLDTLPPMSPDYDAVVGVRSAYQTVTGGRPVTQDALTTVATTVRDAERLLGELRMKHRAPESIAEPQAEPA